MSQQERQRRHESTVERINQVHLLTGTGDRTRIDREGTLLERARMLAQEISAYQATEQGLAAFDRLLQLVEHGPAVDNRDIAAFIVAIWNQQPLPLATLRGLDPQVGDDMLAVLDAFRHARLSLPEHVEGGPARVSRVVARYRQAVARPA